MTPHQQKKPRVVVIAGPTASGKTTVGVELSLRLNGEIINADSMQVYRGMDIGTAKPSAAEQKGVPHHLLDVVEPDEAFNAAIFRSMALPLVHRIDERSGLCLVVGGTGLYIKALLGGLSAAPPSEPELRASLKQAVTEEGAPALHQRLTTMDPQAASEIHPNDRGRIIRALEIIYQGDRPASAYRRDHGFQESILRPLKLYLHVDREQLYRRINERTETMVEEGLVEETEGLLKRGFSPDLKPMQAIGYRHALAYLKGRCSRDEMIEDIKRDTRRYAKRQLTWLRGHPPDEWASPWDLQEMLKRIKAFLTETA